MSRRLFFFLEILYINEEKKICISIVLTIVCININLHEINLYKKKIEGNLIYIHTENDKKLDFER
ncbi:uncharacterized protein BX663DRAFT_497068 [Cokeromyces recurvatus]|uniref:uncharacterized protein n=1 Tax=Cokeromyces recurvatus TaxID=90255 RepID=UPI00221EAA11|nr:uncharacterized protein BX663DRAFT_497068 [Cokeromyces recurvatus]KAI7906606.1 hypothetical protein BX663DRAFT_497068 [Cokeromyces recurvatus]